MSALTAAFTLFKILIEPEPKTEPIIRITHQLNPDAKKAVAGFLAKKLFVDLLIENVGHSIAKDIEVKCYLTPDSSLHLTNDGVFKHSMLAPIPKDLPIKFSPLEFVDVKELSKRKLVVEVSFSNENDKKQKVLRQEFSFENVEAELAKRLEKEGFH